jgi:predicted lipase
MDKVYCPVKVITFGSPRIGNREFENWVDKIIPGNLRIVNQNDIVPNLPSRLFFKHTPNMLHLKEDTYEWVE